MKKLVKKSITLLVGTMALTAVAGLAQAETRFAVQDSVGTDKMVVLDTGYIGVGTDLPAAGIHVKGTNFPNNSVRIEGVNNSGGFIGYLVKPGTALPVNNERIGFIYFGSIYNNTTTFHATGMKAVSEGDWTTTSTPAGYAFETTGPNQNVKTEKVRISAAGNLGIGTTTPTQKVEINGGLRLNTVAGKPSTCDVTLRGTFWYTQGGTGADKVEVCTKNSSGNYIWSQIL